MAFQAHMIDTWRRGPVLLSADDPRRIEISRLARNRRRRVNKSTPARPARWFPDKVRNPDDSGNFFTDEGAWELIARQTENGHRVEIIELEKPKGKTGYVMKIRLESSVPALYVKLELHRGWLLGRSFHLSDR